MHLGGTIPPTKSAPQSKNAVCVLEITRKLLPFPVDMVEKSCRNKQTINFLL